MWHCTNGIFELKPNVVGLSMNSKMGTRDVKSRLLVPRRYSSEMFTSGRLICLFNHRVYGYRRGRYMLPFNLNNCILIADELIVRVDTSYRLLWLKKKKMFRNARWILLPSTGYRDIVECRKLILKYKLPISITYGKVSQIIQLHSHISNLINHYYTHLCAHGAAHSYIWYTNERKRKRVSERKRETKLKRKTESLSRVSFNSLAI